MFRNLTLRSQFNEENADAGKDLLMYTRFDNRIKCGCRKYLTAAQESENTTPHPRSIFLEPLIYGIKISIGEILNKNVRSF